MTTIDLITALGLILVIEGLIYAIWPDGMKRIVATLLALPAHRLRGAGLLAAAIGVAVLWVLYG